MSEALKTLGEHIAASQETAVTNWSIAHGELTVEITTTVSRTSSVSCAMTRPAGSPR